MTSRQRVREALNHRESDMFPIDLGGSRCSGISAVAYRKLKQYLNLGTDGIKLLDVFMQLAEVEPEVLQIIGGDVVYLKPLYITFGMRLDKWKPGKLTDGSDALVPFNFNPFTAEEGYKEIKEGELIIAKIA